MTELLNIVAIGGGTGLSTMLRGLKDYVGGGRPVSIGQLSAIVTVTDEGGSSGRLRKELSMLPPGDIRNCIVALAEEEKLLSRLFSYRFESDSSLHGHSLGNLLIAAMTDIMGGFDHAILAASEVLAIRGVIYPSTLEHVRLRATLEDGNVLVGETAISGEHLIGSEAPQHSRISRLAIDPMDAKPVDQAIAAIENADIIVIGPGSLYTSVLPNLLIGSIGEALLNSTAFRVYVGNIMTQPGETENYSAQEHIRTIVDHAGPVMDAMIVNSGRPSASVLESYAAKNQFPVAFELDKIRELGVVPFPRDVTAGGEWVRHDPRALAEAVFMAAEKSIESSG
ncbi:MAG: YvcK family protein [Xanthomonadales bacterium]|nr:YvcK family protein [Gammaproteobacteria bacterium]MBT8052424.1 YvcK family protein [Gammaproteobacteria bacterium]NND55941.1 YvcK family protein [Xanthomonadales bacterium]NNK50526.1 YvcK family protein [Xanthomonadales bacterium]